MSRAFKLLKCIALHGKNLTYTILSNTKVAEACMQQLALAGDASYLDKENSQIVVEVLKFLNVCISYGYAMEICEQTFGLLSAIMQHPLKDTSKKEESKDEKKHKKDDAIIQKLQCAKLCFVILHSYLTTCGSDTKYGVESFRSFIESDCVIFLDKYAKNWKELREVSLQNVL